MPPIRISTIHILYSALLELINKLILLVWHLHWDGA